MNTKQVTMYCTVDQNCSMEIVDGQLVLTFETTAEIDPKLDVDEQLFELSQDLIHECFDVFIGIEDFEELSTPTPLPKTKLSLIVNNKTPDVLVPAKETSLSFPLLFTEVNDETNNDLWEWADQQDIATINDIFLHNDAKLGWEVVIIPQWDDNLNEVTKQAFTESFNDYFAEKIQK